VTACVPARFARKARNMPEKLRIFGLNHRNR
jgi:hypothetical protein